MSKPSDVRKVCQNVPAVTLSATMTTVLGPAWTMDVPLGLPEMRTEPSSEVLALILGEPVTVRVELAEDCGMTMASRVCPGRTYKAM